MSAKVILAVCVQALLANVAFTQCEYSGEDYLTASAVSAGAASCGSLGGNGLAGYGAGLGYGAGYGNGAGLGYGAGLGNGAGLSYGSGLGYGAGPGYGADFGFGAGLGIGCGNGYAGTGLNAAGIDIAPTSGGALPVSSSSAIAPSGLSVASENAYEGSLAVIGELPFLSAVALEGAFPSVGAGVVNYSCGNGVTAITSDAGYSAGAYGAGVAGIGSGALGYGSGVASNAPTAGLGLAGRGCGCGRY